MLVIGHLDGCYPATVLTVRCWPGPKIGGRSRLQPWAKIAELAKGSFVAYSSQAGPGHKRPTELNFRSGLSSMQAADQMPRKVCRQAVGETPNALPK